MTILWRAAPDADVSQGMSFATKRSTAKLYLDNPGYGGAKLFRTEIDSAVSVLDMTGWSWADVRAKLGVPTPSGIGIDEWLPQAPKMLDRIRELGYLWAKVDESYPRDTVTWIWCGTSLDDEPLLEEVSRG